MNWIDQENNILYAEFYSFEMCSIVFNHMKFLTGDKRVHKFIHPKLTQQHKALSEKSSYLRNVLALKARIDYSSDGLVLLYKEDCSDSDWSLYTLPFLETPRPVHSTNLVSGSHQHSSSSQAEVIAEVDGNVTFEQEVSPPPGLLASSSRADNQGGTSMTYNYSLNKQSQSKCILEN